MMIAERRLLDVISRRLHEIGRHCMYVRCEHFDPDAESVLADLREAIAEDPDSLSEFIPPGRCVISNTSDLHRQMMLGRAVEALQRGTGQPEFRRVGWGGCFDAIYTEARVERQP